MLFNSIPFLIFFSTFIFFIFFLPNQWKIVTILFSIFFYAYWDVYFCLLLLAEALFIWLIGHQIQLNSTHRKKYLLIGLIIPLLILFIFKYFNFFINDVLNLELNNSILILS